jgi:hypothetical protein
MPTNIDGGALADVGVVSQFCSDAGLLFFTKWTAIEMTHLLTHPFEKKKKEIISII